MCSYIVEKVALYGSAKGSSKGLAEWKSVDTAHVYFDHPYHAPLDHALAIDFINQANGGQDRIAIELSAETARDLVKAITSALDRGEMEHAGLNQY